MEKMGEGIGITFEALFGIEVNLLGLCNLFEQFLDDNSIKVSCFAFGRDTIQSF